MVLTLRVFLMSDYIFFSGSRCWICVGVAYWSVWEQYKNFVVNTHWMLILFKLPASASHHIVLNHTSFRQAEHRLRPLSIHGLMPVIFCLFWEMIWCLMTDTHTHTQWWFLAVQQAETWCSLSHSSCVTATLPVMFGTIIHSFLNNLWEYGQKAWTVFQLCLTQTSTKSAF